MTLAPKPEGRTLLGPREAAYRIGVSTRTLEEWRRPEVAKGPIWYRLEGQVRYSAHDIEAWLESCKQNPEAVQLSLPFLIQRQIERRARAREKRASAICGASGWHSLPLFGT